MIRTAYVAHRFRNFQLLSSETTFLPYIFGRLHRGFGNVDGPQRTMEFTLQQQGQEIKPEAFWIPGALFLCPRFYMCFQADISRVHCWCFYCVVLCYVVFLLHNLLKMFVLFLELAFQLVLRTLVSNRWLGGQLNDLKDTKRPSLRGHLDESIFLAYFETRWLSMVPSDVLSGSYHFSPTWSSVTQCVLYCGTPITGISLGLHFNAVVRTKFSGWVLSSNVYPCLTVRYPRVVAPRCPFMRMHLSSV